MSEAKIKVGTVEGTGAALNVVTGFIPEYVKLFNEDDAGSIWATLEWFGSMPAASARKTSSIADDGVTSALSSEKITTLGISTLTGARISEDGFVIGADTDANASGETIHYIAMRSGD